MTQRRRGNELKEAVYAATIRLLENKDYEAVTFQNVAVAAKTTRSVLYRYWDSPFQLIYEAARHQIMKNPLWRGTVIEQNFNTGSLHDDLLELFIFMRNNMLLYPKNFLSYIFFEQSRGRRVVDEAVPGITENNLVIIERILARAQERGEAREDIGQAAKLLPFQILRHHLMLGTRDLSDVTIQELVDDVLLPIYRKNNCDG